MLKIAPDKWKHFYVGIAWGALVYGLANAYWPLQPGTAFVVSSALIIIPCYGFELFSLVTGKGHYELLDAVAGIAGGYVGMGVLFLLSTIL